MRAGAHSIKQMPQRAKLQNAKGAKVTAADVCMTCNQCSQFLYFALYTAIKINNKKIVIFFLYKMDYFQNLYKNL